ncbi:MAG: two-component system response regulator CreB [Colwellia sp.]|nr:two-component system response regulator CreB [Colwellia sp.]
MSQKHILVIEDEPSIADNITYALKFEGFDHTWVTLGYEGIELLNKGLFDLVILDVGLPDINGFEVCKRIRESSNIPIIFLTARGEEIDRVVGLEIGGDDYVVKPFSPRELVARVKVILRRSQNSQSFIAQVSQSFRIDEEKYQINYCGQTLDLTTYEFGLLKMLISQPERVFTREQLMNGVWSSPEESFDRVIDTHIKTIRVKLRAVNSNDHSITTHRGIGYSAKLI